MEYIQELTLDIANKGGSKYIRAKQSDSNHYVKVTMMADGSKIIPASGDVAMFRCLKPDGHSCYNQATINNDGTITARLTSQCLACEGATYADISILNGANVLSTVSFLIMVDRVPLSDNLTESVDEYGMLVDLINQAQSIINDAAESAAAALASAQEAARIAASINISRSELLLIDSNGRFYTED